MAEKLVKGPKRKRASESTAVPSAIKTLTGAGSTWGGQVGGTNGNDLIFDPPLRGIEVVGVAGTLKVRFYGVDEDGNRFEDTPTVEAGKTLYGEIDRLDADSTAVLVRLIW